MLHDQINIYDEKELLLSNRKRKCYLIDCHCCGKRHYKEHAEIMRGLRRNKKFFCSKNCHSKYYSKKQNVICANCTDKFQKKQSQIKKSKNNFCSKSCAATFNNKNKSYGLRRSKIEVLIEKTIQKDFPKISFKTNDKTVINSELDFYFPDIKLAIQINGPLHYKPIYGQLKLNNIQKLDEEKRNKCKEKSIKLIELDYSEDKYLNKKLILRRLNEFKIILAEEIGLDPNTLTNTTSFPN